MYHLLLCSNFQSSLSWESSICDIQHQTNSTNIYYRGHLHRLSLCMSAYTSFLKSNCERVPFTINNVDNLSHTHTHYMYFFFTPTASQHERISKLICIRSKSK